MLCCPTLRLAAACEAIRFQQSGGPHPYEPRATAGAIIGDGLRDGLLLLRKWTLRLLNYWLREVRVLLSEAEDSESLCAGSIRGAVQGQGRAKAVQLPSRKLRRPCLASGGCPPGILREVRDAKKPGRQRALGVRLALGASCAGTSQNQGES